MTKNDALNFLKSLKAAIPTKAPDFSSFEVQNAWCEGVEEHIRDKSHGFKVHTILTGRHKFFPSISEIIEASRRDQSTEKELTDASKKKESARLRYDNAEYRCTMCDLAGKISAFHKTTQTPWGFRCIDCDSAERNGLSKDIPLWHPEVAECYDIPIFSKKRHVPFTRQLNSAPDTFAKLAAELAASCNTLKGKSE